MFKRNNEEIFYKNIFSKYLNKKIIDDIVNGNFKKEEPEEMECGYIIFDILQNDLFELTLKDVLDYSYNSKIFFVDNIYGTIVILNIKRKYFFKEEDNMEEYLKEFITNIPENISKNTRFVYGMENAKVGLFGSNNILRHMVLLKNFYKKLIKIDNLKYGDSEKMEIKE